MSWWLAVACSFAARGIHSVLLPWLLVASLSAGALSLGAVQGGAMLAQALVLILLGGVGDRVGARRVAVAGQLAAALPPLALCALGTQSAIAVAAYALCASGLWGFLCPPRDSLVALSGERDLLRPATHFTLAQFAGLLVGIGVGSAAAALGATALLLAVAALQLVAAFATARVRAPRPVAARAREAAARLGPRAAHDARRAQRELIALTLLLGLCSAGPFAVWVPLLAHAQSAAEPARAIALLQALFPLGTIVGSLLLRRVRGVDPRGGLFAAHVLGSLCIAAAGFASHFALTLACVAGWGLCGAVFISCGRALLLAASVPARRTRALARVQLALLASSPAGALLAGLGAGAADAHTSMRALGAASLCGALAIALRSRRRGAQLLRSANEPEAAIGARPS